MAYQRLLSVACNCIPLSSDALRGALKTMFGHDLKEEKTIKVPLQPFIQWGAWIRGAVDCDANDDEEDADFARMKRTFEENVFPIQSELKAALHNRVGGEKPPDFNAPEWGIFQLQLNFAQSEFFKGQNVVACHVEMDISRATSNNTGFEIKAHGARGYAVGNLSFQPYGDRLLATTLGPAIMTSEKGPELISKIEASFSHKNGPFAKVPHVIELGEVTRFSEDECRVCQLPGWYVPEGDYMTWCTCTCRVTKGDVDLGKNALGEYWVFNKVSCEYHLSEQGTQQNACKMQYVVIKPKDLYDALEELGGKLQKPSGKRKRGSQARAPQNFEIYKCRLDYIRMLLMVIKQHVEEHASSSEASSI